VSSAVSPYPTGVVPVPDRGTSFFPGGLGLWLEEGQVPTGVPDRLVLVVGQDFNTVATYTRVFERGTEVDTSPTWRNLRRILNAANVPLEARVFTNFFMGLRQAGPETGSLPGAKDPAFTRRCALFFEQQLAVWKPELVLTLGAPALRAVGAVCSLHAPPALCAPVIASIATYLFNMAQYKWLR
jgi:uracil-DNA glycosylase